MRTTLSKPNRADRLLAVLADGRERSRDEILHAAGTPWFLVNNAASDLRKQGYDVQHRVRKGSHTYRLRLAGAEPIPPTPSWGRDDSDNGSAPANRLPGWPASSNPCYGDHADDRFVHQQVRDGGAGQPESQLSIDLAYQLTIEAA